MKIKILEYFRRNSADQNPLTASNTQTLDKFRSRNDNLSRLIITRLSTNETETKNLNNGIIYQNVEKKKRNKLLEQWILPKACLLHFHFPFRFSTKVRISTAQLGTVKGTQKHISRTVDYLRINRLLVSYGERGNVEARNFQLFHKAAWPIRFQLRDRNSSPELSWSCVHTN